MNSSKIFKTPFTKEYWQLALKEYNKLRSLIFASILISLTVVLETIGKLSPFEMFGREIHLTFIPLSTIGFLFGPIVGMISGAITDIVGFLVYSKGYPFFPGYTLSAILSSLIYSLFFYRTKITLFKIFSAKFLVNFLINVLIGSYWMMLIMNSKNIYWFYFSGGALKNAIMLPLEVFILYYFFKILIPFSKAYNLISDEIPNYISNF